MSVTTKNKTKNKTTTTTTRTNNVTKRNIFVTNETLLAKMQQFKNKTNVVYKNQVEEALEAYFKTKTKETRGYKAFLN